MAIVPGTMLGPYEILSALGAGGMGEVYRARDTRLERSVAIKVLPANLSSDPSLRQRLEREAKAVSKLSHPHICTLHDIGHQDGVDFLVMELIEGETLEHRLMKGPLSTEQTILYAAQIAEALAKAHKLGITHRDLKPPNVMLTKSGAKLMDFGLAKQTAPVAAKAFAEMTLEQSKLTSEGTIVGTFKYMAPEQLEGKEADARTDIFALGEVIYEMATGNPAFSGKSRASLIAAILTSEPPPMTQLQPVTPLALERVVKKCLAKDPEDRWQSASDLASELNWISGAASAASVPAAATRRMQGKRWVWVCAVLLLLAALAAVYFRPSPSLQQSTWSSVLAPEQTKFAYFAGPVTVSHDGRKLAFVATTPEGQDLVWVRPLDSPNAQALSGTEGAGYPFWSGDDRSIGFFAGGKLKTVEAAGGPVVTICDAPGARGGAWNDSGVILFATTWSGIYRVPNSGGAPIEITKLDPSHGELSHRWPYFLPDGRHFFYLAANFAGGSVETASVHLGLLDSKETRLLFHARSNVAYESRHILYVRDRMLMAQPFDEKRLEILGQPFPIAGQVQYDEVTWRGVFSSSNGILAYQGGNVGATSRLLMFDRAGKELRTIGNLSDLMNHRISPDGQRVAVAMLDPSVANYQLWVYDLYRGKATRFTFGPNRNTYPVWAPDGNTLVFTSNKKGPYDIFEKRSDSTGNEKLVLESDASKYPTSWSADGRFIAYTSTSPGKSKIEIWILPRFGDRKPYVFLQGDFNVGEGQFSPDGRWVTYTSDESGRAEVYVTPFPAGGSKWQVSAAGGSNPRWSRNGKELFYMAADSELMAAQVDSSGPVFQVGAVRPLFHLLLRTGPSRLDLSPTSGQIGYDAAPDGKRFIVNSPPAGNPPPITLVTNWKPAPGK
jgi:eukaryotic-like serine/threonine-protein kinase